MQQEDQRTSSIRWVKYFILTVLCLIIGTTLYVFLAQFFSGRTTVVDRQDTLTEQFTRGTLLPASFSPPQSEGIEILVEEHNPRIGDVKTAKLVIVEFGDFECPFCHAAYPIIREFVLAHSQDVAYVYRHFPLDTIHPSAVVAAIASSCAHEQGKFWPYHDRLFQNQETLAENPYSRFAQAVGLDMKVFTECVASERAAERVARDASIGTVYGVSGTPTFFVNGEKLEGVVSRALWEGILESVSGE